MDEISWRFHFVPWEVQTGPETVRELESVPTMGFAGAGKMRACGKIVAPAKKACQIAVPAHVHLIHEVF